LVHDTNKISKGWKGGITLTFDDGWRSIYDNAFPILRRAGIKATYYIVSGYLDASQFPLYMSIDHVRELYRARHEVGCHSVSHRHLPQEPDALVESEIVCSKQFLSRCGFNAETFAYPFGEYDERVIATVTRAGFIGARSIQKGFNDSSTDPMLLRIQAVKVNTKLSEVIAWINLARSQDKWLILMFHQIDEEGREWSARPETLEQIVGEIQRRSVKTVTVAEGLRAMCGR
jgi:peptidoglycan/xylan/chitin deacetylase (PgdA/CDA1 family)